MQRIKIDAANRQAMPLVSRRSFALGVCVIVGFFLCYAGIALGQEKGLLAHDINEFALDMTVEQVTALAKMPLVALGGDQYGASVAGIDYDFRFSPLGHLYRVDSRQELGNVTVDADSVRELGDRLAQKFGAPQLNQMPAGPATWRFQEDTTDANGQKLKRETESLTVLISGGKGEPVAVAFKLMSASILRRDTKK
jgi:hypothetical protein